MRIRELWHRKCEAEARRWARESEGAHSELQRDLLRGHRTHAYAAAKRADNARRKYWAWTLRRGWL